MSRQCMVTGKKVMMGNNVSHALNRTRREFQPNIQDTSLYSETLGRKVKVRVSMDGLREVEHNGGLDGWIVKQAKTKLHPKLRPVKAEIEAKRAAA